jgi:hypothetical protein
MLSKFKKWYTQNDVEITWFIMGTLVVFILNDFANGFYISGLITLLVAYINYTLRPIR